jgi:hypothetical protein
LRKKGKEPERWHWVYTTTIFRLDQRGHTAAKRPMITDRGYVATRAGLEAFEQLVYAEALRRGLTKAAEVLVIADGAIWIWNLVENRFRRATQRVDLYHVKQHLWSVARQLYDQDTAQARQWLRPLFRQLKTKSNGGQQVLSTLKELLRNKENMTPAQREDLAKEIGYFTTHAHRMNYASGKRKQQPLGSGAIESTFLHVLVQFLDWLQVGAMTPGTALGRWHGNDLINVLGFGPLPVRMAHGSTALFALSPGALRGWSGRDFAAFELAAVQRVELCFELLVLAFQFLVATFSLVELLVEFLELVFVLALQAITFLMAIPNPLCGQALQIRAAVAIRTDELLIQLAESGHSQSSGGSWSKRQLTSESLARSCRTLRWLRVMARTRGTSSCRTYLVRVF